MVWGRGGYGEGGWYSVGLAIDPDKVGAVEFPRLLLIGRLPRWLRLEEDGHRGSIHPACGDCAEIVWRLCGDCDEILFFGNAREMTLSLSLSQKKRDDFLSLSLSL